MCNSFRMPTTANDVIGTAEAAALLSVDRSTLTRWVKDGKIKPFIKGTGRTGELMFRRSEVTRHTSPVSASPEAAETGDPHDARRPVPDAVAAGVTPVRRAS